MKEKLLIFLLLWSGTFMNSNAQQVRSAPSSSKQAASPIQSSQAAQWVKDSRNGFTENKGQLSNQDGKASKSVKYLLNIPGLKVQLRPTGFSYDTYIVKNTGADRQENFHRVDIEFEDANPMAYTTTSNPLGLAYNVINETGTFYQIQQFQTVTYHDIYPGIDIEFIARKGTDKPIEYNFIVHPGADASLIKLRYKGANEMALKAGCIEMSLNHGKLSENIPASWLEQNQKPVHVTYKSIEKNLYAFQIPAYDQNKTLVIDPTPNLEWATYYGGSQEDKIHAIVTDPSGNIYITGSTQSTNNIASAGAYDGVFGGNNDIFIAMFSPDGTRKWATYYGGTGSDIAYGATFHNGQLYVAGTSGSDNLSTAGAHQVTRGNQVAALIARFNATNGQLSWATYYGGVNRAGFIEDIRVDAGGNIIALGGSRPNAFPENTNIPGNVATPGTFRQTGGASTSYLVKFNSAGVRQWGTFVVGAEVNTSGPRPGSSIELDATGHIYIAGSGANATYDANLAANVGEGTVATPNQGYIAKFNNSNGARLWGRFFQGSITDLQLDQTNGQIHVVGSTDSNTGIASPGAYRTTLSAPLDGYWATFNLSGQFVKGTYLGTQSGNTFVVNTRLDGAGNLIVLGHSTTTGGELATDCSYQPNPGGGTDMFINKFNLTTGQRVWGTYFGGAGNDMAGPISGGFGSTPGVSNLAIAADAKILIAGYVAAGSNKLATPMAHQNTYGGGDYDGILAKFNTGALPEGFTVSASSLTPLTQDACILGVPAVITGNAVGITHPSSYQAKLFYQWQKSASPDGPWEDIPGAVYKDLQPTASQTTLYYRRQVKVNTELCNQETVDTSPVSAVIIGSSIAPIANADGPEWFVCGSPNNTITLNGSASGGTGAFTYQWFVGSASTPAVSVANYSPTVGSTTTYTLKVTDAAGCVDMDQVTVTPVAAAAGEDKSNCAGAGIQIGTAPVSNPGITYAWTLASGASAAATLSCTSCAQPIAKPTVATTYRLTVTVTLKGGSTCSTFDDVLVTPVAAPTGGATTFAGTDKTICKNQTVVLGGTPDGAASYTWTTGQFLSDSQIAQPTFQAGTATVDCAINYTVTAVKGGCTFVDEVKVHVINPALNNTDGVQCGPLWITHKNEENCSEAVYSWSVVAGSGSILQTNNNSANAYLNSTSGITTFRRTVTLNGVSCSEDVQVQSCPENAVCGFDITMIGNQGCPKVFDSAPSFKLTTGLPATDYNFSWSPAHMVDNPHAAVVTVTSASNTTITVVVTNKFDASITCTKSILVNNPLWALPTFDAMDKNTCPDTPMNIGTPHIAGFTYLWTPAGGLSSTTISNPVATVAATTEFRVNITETATGCKTVNVVTVNIVDITANAGNDRTVCSGGTYTLGTPAPEGTNWVYSWAPENAAWIDPSQQNLPQPQVLFAGPSQTFTLTVTDPVSGCSKTDQVTLRSTILAGEYAGTPVTACPSESIQLGREAEPFAIYTWTYADDSPATGLSCTSCANPLLTVPNVTTIYKVKVTYPGCAIPMEDLVTVTVKTAPVIGLNDLSYCPTTTNAIGFGANGNPAAPANIASYLWSPSTGLSNTTIANPTTNVKVETTYNLTVTYTNGCIRTDEIKVTPTAIVNAGPDLTVCAGESVVIGTPAIAGATYVWTGAGITSGANTAQPTIKPTATTTYGVTVTIGGCSVIDQVVATVNTPTDFTIAGNTSICEGSVATVGLSGVAPANTSWQWSPVAGVESPNSPNTTIAATGTQTYRLTQTNLTTGCSNYKEVVIVSRPNSIQATTTDANVCPDVVVSLPLNVTSVGDYSYAWSPAAGLSNPFIANPTVSTSIAKTYTVTVTDNVSNCQLIKTVQVNINPAEACYPPVTLSGNVFHDANALTDATVNTTSAITIPTGLFVSLVNERGEVVKTVPVNANGTYDFGITDAGNYSIVLHQTPGGSLTPSLPANWINTGENLGISTGNDDATNGILTGVTVAGTNVINANFGIQQPPLAEPKEYLIDQPLSDAIIVLDGSHVSVGSGTTSPDQMTGTDPEDGTLEGSTKDRTVVITTLPDHGVLYYNNVPVTEGQIIKNYDPSLATIQLTGTGYNNLTYTYAYQDQAGALSPPVTYKIHWPELLPVTLISFEVHKQENQAVLTWSTLTEINSDYFEIQRSHDAKTWLSIKTVNAQGESSAIQKYTYTDPMPTEGPNLYRLKMIDRDGSFAYSRIISLHMDIKFETSIYPNPVGEILHVKVSDWKKVKSVRIDNLKGIQVYKSGPLTSGTVDVKQLPEGIYILQITHTDGAIYTHKLVRIHQ